MDNIEKNRVNPERGMSGGNDDDDTFDSKKDSKKTAKKHSSKKEYDKTPAQKEESKPKRATFFDEFDTSTKKDTEPTKLAQTSDENQKLSYGQETAKSEEDVTDSIKEKTTQDAAETDSETEFEDGLSDEEVHEAINSIIDVRGDELREELDGAEEGSSEELEAVAHTLFLESLRQRADGEEPLTPESVNDAYDEVVDDLEFEPDSRHDDEQTDSSEDAVDVANEDSLDTKPVDVDDSVNTDDGVTSPPPASSPPPPPPPSRTPPPSPPSGGSNNPPYQGSNILNGDTGPQPNSRNSQANYNQQPYQRKRSHDLLVGAIVGYMVGRRGGRKRSEKRLKPKIDKLEAEVATLNTVIAEKEVRIREVARNKINQKPETISVAELTEKVVVNRQKRIEKTKMTHKKVELMSSPKVEKLGVFNLKTLEVFREKRLIDGSENSPKRKPVEIMTVNELSEKVQGLRVDDIDILQAYKDGRISQETLREVTKRYMRSGDYKNYFRRELQNDPNELEHTRQSLEKIYTQPAAQPIPAREDGKSILSQQSATGKNASVQAHKRLNTSSKNNADTSKLALPWVAAATVSAIVVILLLLTFG